MVGEMLTPIKLQGATVTAVVATMEWLHKKILFLYLVWILQFRKKKFVNILEPLVLSR